MINASGRVDNPNLAVSLFLQKSATMNDFIYFERVNELQKKLVEEQYINSENHKLSEELEVSHKKLPPPYAMFNVETCSFKLKIYEC